jgi:hypothetical protein
MNWTKEKPTEPGLYWYRSAKEDTGDWDSEEPTVIAVRYWGGRTDTLTVDMIGSEVGYDLVDAHGDFAGPMHPPGSIDVSTCDKPNQFLPPQ